MEAATAALTPDTADAVVDATSTQSFDGIFASSPIHTTADSGWYMRKQAFALHAFDAGCPRHMVAEQLLCR